MISALIANWNVHIIHLCIKNKWKAWLKENFYFTQEYHDKMWKTSEAEDIHLNSQKTGAWRNLEDPYLVYLPKVRKRPRGPRDLLWVWN